MAEAEASGGGGGHGTERVMVAIDESECSLYALEWALKSLRETAAPTGGGPPLIVFTAQPLANLSYIPAATYGSARMFTAMTARQSPPPPPSYPLSLSRSRSRLGGSGGRHGRSPSGFWEMGLDL